MLYDMEYREYMHDGNLRTLEKTLRETYDVVLCNSKVWTYNPKGTSLFCIPKKARVDLPQLETFFDSSNTDDFLQGLQPYEGKTIATGLCESEGPFTELLFLDCAQGLIHIHVLRKVTTFVRKEIKCTSVLYLIIQPRAVERGKVA